MFVAHFGVKIMLIENNKRTADFHKLPCGIYRSPSLRFPNKWCYIVIHQTPPYRKEIVGITGDGKLVSLTDSRNISWSDAFWERMPNDHLKIVVNNNVIK